MAYFIDPLTNKLYWYADDGSQDDYKVPGLVAATPAQVEAITNPPAPAPVEADYIAGAQDMMDASARAQGYDGILSACTYATSTVARFKAQGSAAVAWRDAVWTEGYSVLAQIQAGTLAAPTLAAFLAGMPTITWPSS